MEWTMEWTDGMDGWNGISANQNSQNSLLWPWRSCKYCLAIAHFNWIVMSTLCFLALYPGPRAECSACG